MIFLGDIHADFKFLDSVLSTGESFKREPETFPDNFSFIRGNHDNPEACKKYPNYLGDFGFNQKFFYVSGAWSIDRSVRVENRDWWSREELSSSELHEAITLFDYHRPQIMVSHTCPTEIARMILCGNVHGSRTENALRSMWEIHKPTIWIFGHWHQSWRKNVLGTNFYCLASNETISLDIQ